jgi:hypothetical protein
MCAHNARVPCLVSLSRHTSAKRLHCHNFSHHTACKVVEVITILDSSDGLPHADTGDGLSATKVEVGQGTTLVVFLPHVRTHAHRTRHTPHAVPISGAGAVAPAQASGGGGARAVSIAWARHPPRWHVGGTWANPRRKYYNINIIILLSTHLPFLQYLLLINQMFDNNTQVCIT